MLAVESVSKMFDGSRGRDDVEALREIDLTIESGELLTITGPSGSGKSTLLFVLGAMMKPSTGRVLLDGVDLYALSSSKRARLRSQQVGFVFQTFNLVPYLSCQDNVALPGMLGGQARPDARRKARELLDRLGLSARLQHLPTELSVGERQRVALARALINEPAVLLADEPTGNLDPERTAQVIDILRELNAGGQTVVLVTHDQVLADVGTRNINLRDGRIGSRKEAGVGVAVS
jgi:putative ABC transport system ATP-binding protein